MTSETPCANCGKAVPPGTKLCPNCGAGIVPLPVLDGSSRVAGASADEFRTGSRRGDVMLGIAFGVLLPLLLLGFAAIPLLGIFGILTLPLFVMIPVAVGIPIFVAHRIKRKYFVLGDAMQKTVWGWLILFGLGFLGLVTVCLLNP